MNVLALGSSHAGVNCSLVNLHICSHCNIREPKQILLGAHWSVSEEISEVNSSELTCRHVHTPVSQHVFILMTGRQAAKISSSYIYIFYNIFFDCNYLSQMMDKHALTFDIFQFCLECALYLHDV